MAPQNDLQHPRTKAKSIKKGAGKKSSRGAFCSELLSNWVLSSSMFPKETQITGFYHGVFVARPPLSRVLPRPFPCRQGVPGLTRHRVRGRHRNKVKKMQFVGNVWFKKPFSKDSERRRPGWIRARLHPHQVLSRIGGGAAFLRPE